MHRHLFAVGVAAWVLTSPALAAPVPAADARPPSAVTGVATAREASSPSGIRVEALPLLDGYRSGEFRLAGRYAPPATATATSDDAGRYALAGFGPGIWRLVAAQDGWVPMQLDPVPVVEALELPPVALNRDAGGRFRVLDTDGRPVSGAWVYADAHDPDAGSPVRRSSGWRVAPRVDRSDEEGYVSLPRRQGETLDVRVFPDGALGHLFADVTAGELRLPRRPRRGRLLEVRGAAGEPRPGVLVRAGDVAWPVGVTGEDGRLRLGNAGGEPLDVWLFTAAGGRSRHRLPATDEPENPTVLTAPEPIRVTCHTLDAASGEPVAGVLVWSDLEPGAWVRSGEGGVASLAVPVGASRVVGAAAGFTVARTAVPDRGKSPAAQHRGLRAVLELHRLRPAYGRVVGVDERPVEGALVTVQRAEHVAAAASPGRAAGSVAQDRTDDAGLFHLDDLPADVLQVRVTAPGFAPLRVRGLRTSHGSSPADLGTFLLAPGVSLAGRVVDAAGEPVVNAAVALSDERRALDRLRRQPAERRRASTSSDEAGRFRLDDLPRGQELYLLAWAPGHLPASVDKAVAPTEEPLTVVLPTAIELHGRVVEENDRPVAGAAVELEVRDGDSPRILASATASSDEAGRFYLDELPPGVAELGVRAPGFQPHRVEGVPVGDVPVEDVELDANGDGDAVDATAASPGEEGELVVHLRRGAALVGRVVTDDDRPLTGASVSAAQVGARSGGDGHFRLDGLPLGPVLVEAYHPRYGATTGEVEVVPEPAPPASLELRFKSGQPVRGRVVDADGRGVAAVLVRLQSLGFTPVLSETRSGEDGAFYLSAVPPGVYDLVAEKPGYSDFRAPRRVQMEDEAVEGIEIRLRRGAHLSGRIIGLEDEELARVVVQARDDQGRSMPGGVDFEGFYEVSPLAPGDWLVEASLAGGGRQAVARVVVEERSREVEADLEFGIGITVRGTVYSGDQPLAGTDVTLRGLDRAVERHVTTDYNGRFRFLDLVPGRYRLQASSPRLGASDSLDLDLHVDREIDVELRSVRVEGRVLAADGGDGLADAWVLFYRQGDAAAAGGDEDAFLVGAASEEDGHYVLHGVTPGVYRVSVRKEGWISRDLRHEVPPGLERDDLDLTLEPAPGLVLEVSLAAGERPDLVTLALLDAADRSVYLVSRNPSADGRFHFPSAPPGEWTALLRAPGTAPATLPLRVPAEPLPVRLAPGGEVRLRVDELLTSPALATARLLAADGKPLRTLTSNGGVREAWPVERGVAHLEAVPPGSWTLQVLSAEGAAWSGAFSVAPAQTSHLRCDAGRCAAIQP